MIAEKNLSVRDAEKKAGHFRDKPRFEPPPPRDVHLDRACELAQQTLGTKVAVQGNSERGRLCIDYYSLDDLHRVLELMGVKPDG